MAKIAKFIVCVFVVVVLCVPAFAYVPDGVSAGAIQLASGSDASNGTFIFDRNTSLNYVFKASAVSSSPVYFSLYASNTNNQFDDPVSSSVSLLRYCYWSASEFIVYKHYTITNYNPPEEGTFTISSQLNENGFYVATEGVIDSISLSTFLFSPDYFSDVVPFSSWSEMSSFMGSDSSSVSSYVDIPAGYVAVVYAANPSSSSPAGLRTTFGWTSAPSYPYWGNTGQSYKFFDSRPVFTDQTLFPLSGMSAIGWDRGRITGFNGNTTTSVGSHVNRPPITAKNEAAASTRAAIARKAKVKIPEISARRLSRIEIMRCKKF